MSSAPFIIELVVAAFITICLLHRYGNWRKQHLIVTIAVFIAWYFSFLIIFVLPLDVSATCYRECQKLHHRKNATSLLSNETKKENNFCEVPWSYMPSYVLPDLWRVVYWSSQLLSWIILPMMQSYEYAGEFSVAGKIKTALYENAIWYGSYLLIFGIILVYVAVHPSMQLNGEQLRIIGITASNTWGLLLLILLMGYGLIELPRTAWNMSVPGFLLSQTLFKISKLSTEKEDVEEELTETLQTVVKASEDIRYNSSLRKYIDTIIKKCPDASEDLFRTAKDDYVDYNDVNGKSVQMHSEKSLVSLHKKVIVITQRAHRTNVQWNMLLQKAIRLDDLEKNRESPDRIFKASSLTNQQSPSTLSAKIEWFWKLWLTPALLKGVALVLMLFTVMLVWSEMTFFSTSPTLSLFAVLIRVAKTEYLYFQVEVISFFTVMYMCTCTYYTVFKMRIFNYYYFAPNHQTDANSLLFSGLLLCRLTYALSLNFLAMIHLDGHVADTVEQASFTVFMGHMDVISFISKGLNVYYPMLILLICLCTYFKVGSRILHCFGVQQFLVDEELSTEYVNEGRDILKAEKRRLQRLIGGGKGWVQRGMQIRQKINQSSQRIDDANGSEDENLEKIDSRTHLNVSHRPHYTEKDNCDRVTLLDSMERQTPSLSAPRTTAYSKQGSRSGPPRNLFDDL
ncbi:G-protein coupled receptor-associated protein LMBRD2-like [Rhopilema esculentum]|uniref:G-protein coupled receptor-associated protein LMBRD2-like n=1 Tax=Rhopilema esculentum TaxID=499914 RepID=UPI0031CFE9EA